MTLNRALVMIALLLGITFVLLAFGNPQWNKYTFMFQTYVWPAKITGPYETPELYLPPKGHIGSWRIWNEVGELILETIDYANGNKLSKQYDNSAGVQRVTGQLKIEGIKSIYTVNFENEGVITKLIASNLADPEDPKVIYDAAAGIDRRREFGISND